jgi:bifunctional enzyme CysN/CysC
MNKREQMNVVVVGHVDHGKSTVIGRLLADTGSLPDGKLEQVRAQCERNARPFEYAFLLDALKDEQAQGITIDTARCFFKTDKREYIIIDAPGHIEFLKNMVSGAARAEAALLVIDAHEGIKENSKRHGYLLSMLGIKKVIILVNKMDLVDYREPDFEKIKSEYAAFLDKLNVKPIAYIPVSARNGENLTRKSQLMPWYKAGSVLETVDALAIKEPPHDKPFRMPVQDIYKFTEHNDDRRIFAGTVETGSVSVGDTVVFRPSGKRSRIASIEGFNEPLKKSVHNGDATGFTLEDELYIKRGELLCRPEQKQPLVTSRFRANVFWMGKAPLIRDKKYKLKIATARTTVRLIEIVNSIDATSLSAIDKKVQLDRHDVAECIFETTKPVAFDTIDEIETTGRFVIVDSFDIAGGGIVTGSEESQSSWLDSHVSSREQRWEHGLVTRGNRVARNNHDSRFVLVTGTNSRNIAVELEKQLFNAGFNSYYLSDTTLSAGIDAELSSDDFNENKIFRIGEIGRILTDAGFIFVTALEEIDDCDIGIIRQLNNPQPLLVASVNKSEDSDNVDLVLTSDSTCDTSAGLITQKLREIGIISDYAI